MRKILIVDDEPGMRITLRGILEKHKFSVTEATNGIEAVEQVRKNKFDAILMDIKMPKLNGVEAFLQIRKIIPALPVIMMTGYALEKQTEMALKSGVATILSKPLNLPKVLSLLNKLAANKNKSESPPEEN